MHEKDLRRIREFWDQRAGLTNSEFFNELISHPDIPDNIRFDILAFVSRGSPSFDFPQFVDVLDCLNDNSKGWPGGISKSQFANIPADTNSTLLLHEIIASVTHFDVDEIVWLEQRFWNCCDRQSWSLSKGVFGIILSATIRNRQIVDGIFRLFSQHGHNSIGFKEFVCGLSSLCRGPDVERLKFVTRIWDSDMDGTLSHKDLRDLFEYFNFDDSTFGESNPGETVNVIDFVCFAVANPIISDALIRLSEKIWQALTKKQFEAILNDEREEKKARKRERWESDGRNRILSSKRRMVGVKNIGHTCYMGAAIQTLANVAPLTGFVLSNEQRFFRLPIVRNYARILCSLVIWRETASPRPLKQSVSAICSLFEDNYQHDSQEFLQFLLDSLHENLKSVPTISRTTSFGEMSRTLKSNWKENNNNNSANLWTKSTKVWTKDVNCPDRRSIVLDLFAGQLLSELRCPNCGHSSNSFELFTMLQLPIPTSEVVIVTIKVIRRDNASMIVRQSLRVSISTEVWRLKRLVSEQINVNPQNILFIVLNKSDAKYNATFSRLFSADDVEPNGADCTMLKDIPLSGLDIWCIETDRADAIHLICVHRRIQLKRVYAVREMDGIDCLSFGVPFALTVHVQSTTKSVTAGQLYERICDYLKGRYLNFEKRPNSFHNRALDANVDFDLSSSIPPFELAFTREDAIWCNKCDWTRFCRGCPIDPKGDLDQLFDLDKIVKSNCLITINWTNIAALYLLFNNLAERYENGPGMSQKGGLQQRPLSISECLDDFVREESIIDSRCDECKQRLAMTKRYSFIRLPDILIINFKRFKIVPSLNRYVKQCSPVWFPLDNFDPSPYLTAYVPSDYKRECSRYSCIGIVVHHGQLDYGHYCSYVRDSFSEDWFFCDDDRTYPIKQGEVDIRDAYIVFYQRVSGVNNSKSGVNEC